MSDIQLDFNRIKRSEMSQLFEDMDATIQTKDMSGFAILDKWMARTITAWPYVGDPSDIATYADLGLEDYMQAIREFSAGFRRLSNADSRSADPGGAPTKSGAIAINGRRAARRHAAPPIE